MKQLPDKFEEKKLICEFMDCEVHKTYESPAMIEYLAEGEFMAQMRVKTFFPNPSFGNKVLFQNVLFDSSWDWLMEVVDKIHKVWDVSETFETFELAKTHKAMKLAASYADINDCFTYVVEFIKLYNNQLKIKI